MSNIAPLSISVASVLLSGVLWWTHRANLKLNLYNRRFDIYSRTLDLFQSIYTWNPTESEKATTSLKDSPELYMAQKAFIKATREAQFLFADSPQILALLKEINDDTFFIIGHKRDIAPKMRDWPVPEVKSEYTKFTECLQRIGDSVISLEKLMSEYLRYKGGWLRLLPR